MFLILFYLFILTLNIFWKKIKVNSWETIHELDKKENGKITKSMFFLTLNIL